MVDQIADDPWQALVTRILEQRQQVGAPYGPMPQPGQPGSATSTISQPASPEVQPLAQPGGSSAPFSIGAFFRGLSKGNTGLIPSLTNATQQGESENLTAKALKAHGMSDDDIAAAQRNPDIMRQVLTEAFAPKTLAVKPGEVIINRQGSPVFDNRERQKPNIVGPGQVMYEPGTNKPIGQGGLAPQDRADILKTTDTLETIRAAKEAMLRAKALSSKSYSGVLAGADTWLGNNLPSGLTSQQQKDAAQATAELNNIAQGAALQNAKANGGARVTVYLDKAFQALAPNASMPPALREKLLDEAIRGFDAHEAELRDRIGGIKSGAMYQPGQTPGAQPSAAQPARVRTYNPQTGRLE